MKKSSGFEKFFKGKEKTGGAKKEAIRQDKRQTRKQREEEIAEHKRQKRAKKAAGSSPQPPKYNLDPPSSRFQKKEGGQSKRPSFSTDKQKRDFGPRNEKGGKPNFQQRDDRRKPFDKRPAGGEQRSYNKPDESKPFGDKGKSSGRPANSSFDRDSKPAFDKRDKPSIEKKDNAPSNRNGKPSFDNREKPFLDKRSKPPYNKERNSSFDRQEKPSFDKREKPSFTKKNKPFAANEKRFERPGGRSDERVKQPQRFAKGPAPARPQSASEDRPRPKQTIVKKNEVKSKIGAGKKPQSIVEKERQSTAPATASEQMPLNKFIAHSGVCSRRDAVDLIKAGKVKVNGELVLEPGHKVELTDDVTVTGKHLKPVKDFIYILLNKPKDYITTTEDPQERKTVLDLLHGAPETRIYPVGRLDRNTSGVLLLTNDGDLSQKLTHPSNEIKKVYAVTLDKPLTKNHFEDILRGVELEDGPASVDLLAYTDANDHTQIGVELHTGRNRIVRRIFEHFGYDVKALDRVVFAGLTKKNVNRGKWRYLNEREVRDLKFFKKGRS